MRSKPKNRKRLTCCFCKSLCRRKNFTVSLWQACEVDNPFVIDNGRINCHPVVRYCRDHAPRTAYSNDPHPIFRDPLWLEVAQLTCLHCGADVSQTDGRSTGCLQCLCGTCPRANHPRYIRYNSKRILDQAPEIKIFFREGPILMAEERSSTDSNHLHRRSFWLT